MDIVEGRAGEHSFYFNTTTYSLEHPWPWGLETCWSPGQNWLLH